MYNAVVKTLLEFGKKGKAARGRHSKSIHKPEQQRRETMHLTHELLYICTQ
jgi:hypothetical protein